MPASQTQITCRVFLREMKTKKLTALKKKIGILLLFKSIGGACHFGKMLFFSGKEEQLCCKHRNEFRLGLRNSEMNDRTVAWGGIA